MNFVFSFISDNSADCYFHKESLNIQDAIISLFIYISNLKFKCLKANN